MEETRAFSINSGNKKNKFYIVREHGNKYWSCSCPHWSNRLRSDKVDCEHIVKIKLLIMTKSDLISKIMEEYKILGYVKEETKRAYKQAENMDFSFVHSVSESEKHRKITF